MPARMLGEMVKFSVMWLNSFPAKNGISKSISPRQLLIGLALDYNKHCRMPFGGYAHVNKEPTVTNDVNEPRTIGTICLGPTGNDQGSYKLLSLKIRQMIKRSKFTELPMLSRVIRRVHYLGWKTKCSDGVTFYDRSKVIIDDSDVALDDAASTA